MLELLKKTEGNHASLPQEELTEIYSHNQIMLLLTCLTNLLQLHLF